MPLLPVFMTAASILIIYVQIVSQACTIFPSEVFSGSKRDKVSPSCSGLFVSHARRAGMNGCSRESTARLWAIPCSRRSLSTRKWVIIDEAYALEQEAKLVLCLAARGTWKWSRPMLPLYIYRAMLLMNYSHYCTLIHPEGKWGAVVRGWLCGPGRMQYYPRLDSLECPGALA